MTLNIPAFDCQIHLCLCERERERGHLTKPIFVQGKTKTLQEMSLNK